MKMEGGLVEHRREPTIGNNINRNNKVIIKKRKKKMKKEFIPFSFPLQQLYSYSKALFKGPGIVPPPQHVHNLCKLLGPQDRLRIEDFGLCSNIPFFNPGSTAEEDTSVSYTTVYKCKNFSLVLLFLPATAVIPLHNHPGMTVFSKLLVGQMHIKAFDWADSVDADQCNKHSASKRSARLIVNSTFKAPCNTTVLYPTSGGNIHEFTAITPCAVLDVIGPPYSKEEGRDCSYYQQIPAPTDEKLAKSKEGDEQSYIWLEEIEMPENAKMDGMEYLGPQIIETPE